MADDGDAADDGAAAGNEPGGDSDREDEMSKGGDNREQRAKIRRAEKSGQSASEAGLSTGAAQQRGAGDEQGRKDAMHAEKGKS